MTRVPYTDDDAAVPTVVAAPRTATRTARGLRVRVTAGPDAGLQGTVAAPRAILGRSPSAELRLSDPTVSSFHAEIGVEPVGVSIKDMESRNGLYYQGARIGWAVVPSGSSIQIGASTVCLELDSPFEVEAAELASFGELCGESAVMRELFALLARLARTELSVLVEGPTGSGKELAARGLHDQSPRAAGPFVVLDCTAIPSGLAESILFGHERGAFTGATERRPGIFETAAGGTVFLDEIGELGIELQPKLLRVLERSEVVRVGSTRPEPVDVRVVSATWRDLRARINQGIFREDLYYRLAHARVVIPSLADRRQDIAVLVRHFLAGLATAIPCAREISDEALAELCRRDYPGNVRELKNTIARAALTAASSLITPNDLAFERMLAGESRRTAGPPLAGVLEAEELPRFKDAKNTLVHEFERQYLERLLARTGGNLSRASALAGIERHHLRDLARKHGLRDDG